MAASFDRWEKDRFFASAEEVQESADRMESVYRLWIQARNNSSDATTGIEFTSGELRGELRTALGTAKWQLEQLERALRSNDDACSVGEDTRDRHDKFVAAIRSRISMVEDSLRQSNLESGETALAWVRLDDGERDELARFLSGSVLDEDVPRTSSFGGAEVGKNATNMNGEASIDCFKNSAFHSNDSRRLETREEKSHGHGREASGTADVGSWAIVIPCEGDEDASGRSPDDGHNLPSRRMLSFSRLTDSLKSTPRMRWLKNGVSKWRGRFQHSTAEYIPLQNHGLSQGINSCYERSKSYLSSYGEDIDDKQLYGCLGSFQRQLQRSQYQIQFGHPVQIILWAILAVMLIVTFVLHIGW